MKRHRLEHPRSQVGTGKWSDLSGLLIPLSEEERIVKSISEGLLDNVRDIRAEFVRAQQNYAEYRWAWSYRLIREYYNIEGDITPSDADRIQQDYITARRTWIAEIRKDAEKEYELGDITPEVLQEFLERLDNEVQFETLKYDM